MHGVALAAIEEESSTAGDKVHLISIMRRLRVGPLRCVQFDLQRAVREDGNGEVPWRGGPSDNASTRLTCLVTMGCISRIEPYRVLRRLDSLNQATAACS